MSATQARHASPRRVLAARDAKASRVLAHTLAKAGIKPNIVSMAGLVIAAGTGALFAWSATSSSFSRTLLLVAAGAGVQLRLLCNLLDGMLAVEEGLKSTSGEIYNDLPDRLADVLILTGAGYSISDTAYGPALGWSAATLAVITAYVRVLGGSLGLSQHFCGPMAKPHRMFTLTVAALAAATESAVGGPARAMSLGLAVIVAGSLITLVRRTRLILREAEAR